MRAWTPIIVITLVLAGCSEPESQGPPAAETEASELEALLITDAGLDGYPAGSGFDIELVREAVPGYEVRESQAMSEGMSWPVIIVELDGEELLEIGPDPMGTRVGLVDAKSRSVATTSGHRVGDRFEDIYAGQDAACEAGMEEMSGTVLCPAPDLVQLYYRFGGQYNGPDGQVPPAEVLSSWTVTSVIWSIH